MDVTCHLDKADLQDYISRVFGKELFRYSCFAHAWRRTKGGLQD